MSVQNEVQAIYDSHGKLTPQLVLDEARAKSHPLHNKFEWDNRVAGEKYRLQQAHELIRSVKIKYARGDDTTGVVRKFHAVRSSEGGYEYRSAEDVVLDDVSRVTLLRDMQRDFQQLRARYAHFSEWAEMLLAEVRGETG